MDPQNDTKGNAPAMYLAAAVGLLLAGAVIGGFVDPYLPASISNAKKGYQTGFDAAKTLVLNSSVGNFFKTPDDVRALSGTIMAIDQDHITFRLDTGNPFDDPTLAVRTAISNASTSVTILTFTSQPKASTSTAAFLVPVASATTTPASMSSLRVGDSIRVIASENIKALREFPVSEIQIMQK